MATQTISQMSAQERKLLEIARALPPERVSLLIDFALFLRTRTTKSHVAQETNEESDFDIAADHADEAEWDAQFANSLDVLEQLAEEALTEYRAGKTLALDPDKL